MKYHDINYNIWDRHADAQAKNARAPLGAKLSFSVSLRPDTRVLQKMREISRYPSVCVLRLSVPKWYGRAAIYKERLLKAFWRTAVGADLRRRD